MMTCFIYDDQLTESLIFITSIRYASFVPFQSLVIKKNEINFSLIYQKFNVTYWHYVRVIISCIDKDKNKISTYLWSFIFWKSQVLFKELDKLHLNFDNEPWEERAESRIQGFWVSTLVPLQLLLLQVMKRKDIIKSLTDD